MLNVLYDMVHSLNKWGCTKVFIINARGDPLHIRTIVDAMKKIRSDHDMYISYIFEEESNGFYNFSEEDG